jgi:integrase
MASTSGGLDGMNHETATKAHISKCMSKLPFDFPCLVIVRPLGCVGRTPSLLTAKQRMRALTTSELTVGIDIDAFSLLSADKQRIKAKLKGPPPPLDGLHTPADAAPMKCTVQEINELVKSIRSGEPPKLPEGIQEKRYYDSALPGFYIRLLKTGAASWVVQYKRLGRQKKIAVGDVKVFDRQEAITAARRLLAKITLGTLDPHEARRERMRANKVTFATLVPLFIEQKKNAGQIKSITEAKWKSYFTGYYLKTLHNLPIDEITGDQIQTRIDTIASQSGNSAAESCFDALRVFFKWAIKTGKLPKGHHKPTDDVQAPAGKRSRKRVLSDDEIRLIWKTCDAWEAHAVQQHQFKETTGKTPVALNNPDAPRAVKLLFLTGCRIKEIGGLQWSEVGPLDDAELFIPGWRRKSRKSKEDEMDLCVPLADMAVQILRGIAKRPSNWTSVFSGRGVGRGLERVPGVDLNSVSRRIDGRIAKAGGIPPPGWTAHDIRRTFRTRLAALGVSMNIGEALLGHIGHRNQIVRTYDRHEYWPEKRQALAKYEDHLRAIIDGTAEKIARPNFGQRKGGTA